MRKAIDFHRVQAGYAEELHTNRQESIFPIAVPPVHFANYTLKGKTKVAGAARHTSYRLAKFSFSILIYEIRF
ncbi:MAG: hypothetical protein AB8G77_14470 [Rhodothermales bacterium]